MKGKWMIAPGVLAALVPVSLHVSGHTALSQPGAGNPDRQAVIEKSFGPTKQVEVRDPFYNNMVAYTITIPKDWVFEGTVLHGPGCNGLYYQSIAFRAYSPDAAFGVQVCPGWITTIGKSKMRVRSGRPANSLRPCPRPTMRPCSPTARARRRKLTGTNR